METEDASMKTPPKARPSLDKKSLAYTIENCSSMSANYAAENILVDKPGDQLSRWSSDTNTPPQFIVLKLAKNPAVVTSITFGKYEKTHVCNLKRFKVLGGMTQDESNMIQLIDSGLRNDSQPETFNLRHTLNNHYFPCQYIKILPIQSWGPSFNFSIWYVSLQGEDSPAIIEPAIEWHRTFREEEAIRLCLKHFRQKNYVDVFQSLLQKTRVRLEDPRLTSLYDSLVVSGDYELTETLVENAIEEGLFDDFINSQHPSPQWTALVSPDDEQTSDSAMITSNGSSGGSTGSETPPAEAQMSPAGQEVRARAASIEASALAAAVIQEQMQLDQMNEPQLGVNHQINLGGVVHDPRVPPPQPSASMLRTPSKEQQLLYGSDPHPGSRGGHQMVLDSNAQMIYLFGGWDGTKDLSDFWSYNISESKWKLISPNTYADGGPSQRSCHKMVIDTENKHIFTLGRYLERSRRDDDENIKSDFFMYDIMANKWTLITDDTSAMGGPNLIFDHQMCIDRTRRTIYVFGGQSLYSPTSAASAADEANTPSAAARSGKCYSGLYEYHIPTNSWKKLRDDQVPSTSSSSAADQASRKTLKSRSSHSMLFHPGLRKLYIFGGQRKHDEYLSDFLTYDVDTDVVESITNVSCGSEPSVAAIPAAGYTQRATIDCQRSEIHVMTGLNFRVNKEKDAASKGVAPAEDPRVTNSFWVYSIPNNKWTCFYRYDAAGAGYCSVAGSQASGPCSEPKPRYAHQLVYDDANRVHFMFGGNPGGKQGKEDKLRLGDFWRLKLMRPDQKEIFRRCCLVIRTSKFLEMTSNANLPPSDALVFLQSRLSNVVNHQDEEEERSYQGLASHLFGGSMLTGGATCQTAGDLHALRNDLFEKLAAYFPSEMTRPKGNLLDLIPPLLSNSYNN